MTKPLKAAILLFITLGSIILVFTLSAIKQDASYHNFADNRVFLQVPNFYNVISNIPFFILGVMGLYSFFKQEKLTFATLSTPILCMGIAGIGLGSAYYHYNPTNSALVWDRIPMTVTFMAFFSIIIGKYIDKRWAATLLLPLVCVGVVSVLQWYAGERSGAGDLRLYVFVQFYPMLAIPLILFLYNAPRAAKIQILTIIVIYAIAKFFEHEDEALFNLGGFISGHSLKHLFAAASVFLILRMGFKI